MKNNSSNELLLWQCWSAELGAKLAASLLLSGHNQEIGAHNRLESDPGIDFSTVGILTLSNIVLPAMATSPSVYMPL